MREKTWKKIVKTKLHDTYTKQLIRQFDPPLTPNLCNSKQSQPKCHLSLKDRGTQKISIGCNFRFTLKIQWRRKETNFI